MNLSKLDSFLVQTVMNETTVTQQVLIMKGGGVKGLALAGALKELDPHYRFSTFVGTSAGAIAAVLLAAGYTASELQDVLRKTRFKLFLDPFYKRFGNVLSRGLHSGDPIKAWVLELLKRKFPNHYGEIKLSDFPHRAVLYAAARRKGLVIFDSEGSYRDTPAELAVRCSMAIPYFFTAPYFHDDRIFDGGILANFPLQEFLNENANPDFVALYLLPSEKSLKTRTIIGTLYDILMERNEPSVLRKYKSKIVIIDPAPISTTDFDLSDDEANFLIQQGRLAAKRFLFSNGISSIGQKEIGELSDHVALLKKIVIKARRSRLLKKRFRNVAILLLFALLFIFREALIQNPFEGSASRKRDLPNLKQAEKKPSPQVLQTKQVSAERSVPDERATLADVLIEQKSPQRAVLDFRIVNGTKNDLLITRVRLEPIGPQLGDGCIKGLLPYSEIYEFQDIGFLFARPMDIPVSQVVTSGKADRFGIEVGNGNPACLRKDFKFKVSLVTSSGVIGDQVVELSLDSSNFLNRNIKKAPTEFPD